MKSSIILYLLLTLFVACGKKKKNENKSTGKFLIKEYITLTDSIFWADSIDQQYKVLVAYHNNDTVYLKKTIDILKLNLEQLKKVKSSCIEFPVITSYNFNQVYQFHYHSAFCDKSVNITVGSRNDSIFMFAFLLTHNRKTDSCLSIERVEKSLSHSQWQTIQRGINYSDFWGLMPDNFNDGLDGSSLYVTGYKDFPKQYYGVSRWAAEETALGESFIQVFEMSGFKNKCFPFKPKVDTIRFN